MASKKYGYYNKGNKLGLAQQDTTDATSDDYGKYKSPTATVDNGLEIEYAYSPNYRIASSPAANINKFYINGWTVVNGYLTFIRDSATISGGVDNWQVAPLNAVTGGSNGGDSDYIIVQGSDKWNGLHRVQTAGTPANGHSGMLVTYTKVGDVPSAKVNGVDLLSNELIYTNEDSDGIASLHTADGSDVWLSSLFNAGDYIWVNSNSAIYCGFFKIDSVTTGVNSETLDKIYFSTRYFVHGSVGDSEANASDLSTEGSGATNVTAGTFDGSDNTNGVYKAERDFCYLLTDIEVMKDESFELDITRPQANAVVYYLKAKNAEDMGDLEKFQYYMAEFKKQLERASNRQKKGIHQVQGFWGMRR